MIPSIKSHPVKAFVNSGIPVSINTDDPKMFGTSLAEEYRILKETFHFSDTEIQKIILNSIQTTWLTENEKSDLITDFKNSMD